MKVKKFKRNNRLERVKRKHEGYIDCEYLDPADAEDFFRPLTPEEAEAERIAFMECDASEISNFKFGRQFAKKVQSAEC